MNKAKTRRITVPESVVKEIEDYRRDVFEPAGYGDLPLGQTLHNMLIQAPDEDGKLNGVERWD